jgi:metallophosphoesterase (TIGR00282 family)
MRVRLITEMQSKSPNHIRVICLGDVVGRPGRRALSQKLAPLRARINADLVVVNGENAAGGMGIDSSTAQEIRAAGVDVITLGDHAFQRKGSSDFLTANCSWCIRPANYPSDSTPGSGFCSLKLADGTAVYVINLLGRTFISGVMECPFRTVDKFLEGIELNKGRVITICDMHAEATSEKYAMARHLDGRVSLLFGTHTHVQTSDAQVLPGGTGYITDLGMTGNRGGVIGMSSSIALQRFLSPRPAAYQIEEGDGELCGVVADIDNETGLASGVYLLAGE